jgi:outer membrane protein, heavy metal efflux system
MVYQSITFSRFLTSSALALSLSACASVDQEAAFGGLKSTLGDRVTQDLAWRRDGASDAAITAKVDELLAKELSFDGAVQLALLNNRGLQARYADIGIANADLVQAGLLSNPVLDLMIRPTTNPSDGSILELGLAQNVLDVFMRPARQRVAKAEFEKTQSEVAADVVATVGQVRGAYVQAVGARNAVAVVKEIAAAGEASWELAQRFHNAGNISDLQLAEEHAIHEDMQVLVDKKGLEAGSALEDLAALLNVAADAVKLPEKLPDLPATDATPENAVTIALDRRLDMAAARKDVSAHLEQLKLTTSSRLWQEIELKVDAEREPDGQWAIGPGLAIALPLFDQGGPAVARAASALMKAESDMREREAHIRAEVRKAMANVGTVRRIAQRYLRTILPLKQDIVRLKQEKYNFMLIGVFDVLMAKREETSAYLDYVEAVRDYWLARAELANAMGGMAVETTPAAAGATP